MLTGYDNFTFMVFHLTTENNGTSRHMGTFTHLPVRMRVGSEWLSSTGSSTLGVPLGVADPPGPGAPKVPRLVRLAYKKMDLYCFKILIAFLPASVFLLTTPL